MRAKTTRKPRYFLRHLSLVLLAMGAHQKYKTETCKTPKLEGGKSSHVFAHASSSSLNGISGSIPTRAPTMFRTSHLWIGFMNRLTRIRTRTTTTFPNQGESAFYPSIYSPTAMGEDGGRLVVLVLPPPSSHAGTVLHGIKYHRFRHKKWRRVVYGIGTANEDVEPLPEPPLDEVFIGKYRIIWTIRNFSRRRRWRYRELNAPPIRTDLFNLAHYRNFQLLLWPDGEPDAPPGYISMELFQPEPWDIVEDDICLFVDEQKKGPFKYKSHDYMLASKAICKLEDLNLKNDEIKVGVEISAI